LACGEFEKAKTVLLKMAKVNNKIISPNYMDQLKVDFTITVYKIMNTISIIYLNNICAYVYYKDKV